MSRSQHQLTLPTLTDRPACFRGDHERAATATSSAGRASLHFVPCRAMHWSGRVALISSLVAMPLETQQAARPMRLAAQFGGLSDTASDLTEVTVVMVSSHDTLLVAQPRDRLIRVFSKEGRPIRIIGRPGSGPGEFTAI